MVLDLNKIVIYGKSDGTLAKEPQRQLFSLSDGIIGGQGDGPLKPEPLPLGIIAFTNHSGFHDLAMAALMGFDVNKIPMLKTISESTKKVAISLKWNEEKITLDQLRYKAVKTIPPPGWIDYLSNETRHTQ